MDLYSLHIEPHALHGHASAYDTVPSLVWARYKFDNAKLKENENIFAKDAQCAYEYARKMCQRFPKGEAAIAKSALFSFKYAMIVNERFPKGEDAIAKDAYLALQYAYEILKAPFPKAEAAIAKCKHKKDFKDAINYQQYLRRFPERTETLEKLA
jgi:hypothetical protein